MDSQERGRRRVRVGKVISDKMDKTVVISSERIAQHRLYKKTVKETKKFKAHDEKNEAKIGDLVEITESRPLSKDKRWRITKIIEKAK